MDQYVADGSSMEMDMAGDKVVYNEETLDNILALAKDIIEEQKLLKQMYLKLYWSHELRTFYFTKKC